MKTHVIGDSIQGKTIEKVTKFHEDFAMVFTDGTYTIIKAISDCDGGHEIDLCCPLPVRECNDVAFEYGIITEEEQKRFEKEEEEEYEVQEKQREDARKSPEYKTYLMLREKFRNF
jgi:hypothetical protein